MGTIAGAISHSKSSISREFLHNQARAGALLASHRGAYRVRHPAWSAMFEADRLLTDFIVNRLAFKVEDRPITAG